MPEDLEEFDPEPDPEPPDIRQLRKQAKEAEQLRQQLAAMEPMRREHAALKAGLTGLSDKQLAAGLATYDGDISDAETLRSHFTDLGMFHPEPEPPAVPQGEFDAQQRIADASAGAATGDWDPIAEMDQVDWRDPQAAEKVTAIARRAGVPISEGH